MIHKFIVAVGVEFVLFVRILGDSQIRKERLSAELRDELRCDRRPLITIALQVSGNTSSLTPLCAAPTFRQSKRTNMRKSTRPTPKSCQPSSEVCWKGLRSKPINAFK